MGNPLNSTFQGLTPAQPNRVTDWQTGFRGWLKNKGASFDPATKMYTKPNGTQQTWDAMRKAYQAQTTPAATPTLPDIITPAPVPPVPGNNPWAPRPGQSNALDEIMRTMAPSTDTQSLIDPKTQAFIQLLKQLNARGVQRQAPATSTPALQSNGI